MNWINLEDKEKIYFYAKKYHISDLQILSTPESNSADTYFQDFNGGNKIYNSDFYIYNIDKYNQLKNIILEMFNNKEFKNPELLATIISSIACKNKPQPLVVEDDSIAGTSGETVRNNNAPPIFIYEF